MTLNALGRLPYMKEMAAIKFQSYDFENKAKVAKPENLNYTCHLNLRFAQAI